MTRCLRNPKTWKMLGLLLGLGCLLLSPLPAAAQPDSAGEKWPALNDEAGWAKVEQRRQARLEKVQGVTEFNAGNYQRAAEHFANFVRVFPDDPQGREYLDLARKWAQKKQ